MKVSESWLHEWIRPSLSKKEVLERLTMAGLEIESVMPVGEFFSGVVVGEILSIEKHPNADRLNLCEVDIGSDSPLKIVCGAKNIVAGMRVPTALDGAVLPNNFKIKTSKIRDVVSQGMLCSAVELGLAEESEGLFVFPSDTQLGIDVWEHLQLADHIIDISITPNRGDCLSVKGIAKEISALTGATLTSPSIQPIDPSIKDALPVYVHAPKACSHYVGRVVKNIRADVDSPMWLKERLRRLGVRSITPVVDIMNYVMLELGQPMHAFDLDMLSQEIHIRLSNDKETLVLLNGQAVELKKDTLIIADNQKPLAMAGVMGGLDSAVTTSTKNIFIESAYFHPENIARTARHFNLMSDSSYRFERGIDPELQVFAIERATELLMNIVGGEPGPVVEVREESHIPKIKKIPLRKIKLEKILGMHIPAEKVEAILVGLGFSCEKNPEGWEVTVPPVRSDIAIEVDLIEEVMRVNGSDKVPLHDSVASLKMLPVSDKQLHLSLIRNLFCALGYCEIISYSFVDKQLQSKLDPHGEPKPLLNPITADMNVMRTNLWPGLINTLLYNQNRQQTRIRIFETGLRFVSQEKTYHQERVISGLITGFAFPEQWNITKRHVDFFDLKGDLESLFKLTHCDKEFSFQPGFHEALHPKQTADIYRAGKKIGVLGALHPTLIQSLDIQNPSVFLFEIGLDQLEEARLPVFQEISKFPEIRRDIAIFVESTVPAQSIHDTIVNSAGSLLKEVNLFDIYQGHKAGETRKSVALSLTLQHSSRTLVDDEITQVMEQVILALKHQLGAELRG